ncbi:MAG: 3-dehydroquinate synthase, partial [bacterium]|nr:3-dehydroquinate synthase [bacterium]
EVIKYGVIGDLFLFSFLEKNRKKVLSRNPATLSFLVEQSARAKAWVVGRDEKESGLRMTLNFGHTLGHAIEKQTGYGSWRHGEAVAQGMRLAARISLRQKQCFLPAVVRLETLLKDYGLLKKKVKTARGRLIQAVLLDKKGFKGKVRFVFMRGIGKVLVKAVPPRQLQWV